MDVPSFESTDWPAYVQDQGHADSDLKFLFEVWQTNQFLLSAKEDAVEAKLRAVENRCTDLLVHYGVLKP